MKKINKLVIVFLILFISISCSDDDHDHDHETPKCPKNQNITMKINGELKEFDFIGRGINLNKDGTHTLDLNISTGVFIPEQNSYAISIELPYKKTGTNIIQNFRYLRISRAEHLDVDFIQGGNLQSEVTANTNSCLSVNFYGRAVVDNKEVIITDGIINLIYDEPFD